MRKTAFFIISLAASALAFPGAAEAATSSVKCSGGGGTITASTGNSSGACVTGATKVICKDSGGKVVSQGVCTSGTAVCGNSTGAGSCTISRKLVSTKPKRPPVTTTHR